MGTAELKGTAPLKLGIILAKRASVAAIKMSPESGRII
jgi:hypothetical protein